MFDIGAPELLVIAVVLIVVVGPKDLPQMLRTFGKTTSKLRAMAGDFRKQFDEALKEAELDDVKDIVSTVRKADPLATVKKELNPLTAVGREISKDIEKAVKPDLKIMDPPHAASAEPTAPAEPAKGAVAGKAPEPKKAAAKAAAAKKALAAKKAPAAKKPAPAKAPAKTAKAKPAAPKKGAKA